MGGIGYCKTKQVWAQDGWASLTRFIRQSSGESTGWLILDQLIFSISGNTAQPGTDVSGSYERNSVNHGLSGAV
jgi:hypothetical protein